MDSIILKTYLMNFVKPDVSRVAVFPEFPNTSSSGKRVDSDDSIPRKLLNFSKKTPPSWSGDGVALPPAGVTPPAATVTAESKLVVAVSTVTRQTGQPAAGRHPWSREWRRTQTHPVVEGEWCAHLSPSWPEFSCSSFIFS
jgi:hypothetical protein